ncbi:hypothetical protein [Flavobacterium psychrophilum]|uniref:hypothetical protein n=1 Tax=Flavobacterium psychrophilum TaxID=96345 RepID=UPI000B7C3AFE|nr:hypothetical protein [Flavobacterium psychrophilum]SNA77383.1 conserved hypothetical protein [Flavobacterium psychrophilum]
MIDLVEVLRTKTESIGWVFHYGRSDFQNLVETESDNDLKWYFFLDPISADNSNSSSVVSTGFFMVLSKSDLDQVYDGQQEVNPNDGKFRKNILPKKQYLKNEFRNLLECGGDLELTKLVMTDVINFFDDNLDGVLVHFSITQFT